MNRGGGTRPAVIVSNDKGNNLAPIVEVVYLTTKTKSYIPTHVRINSVTCPSIALCEQVTTVSKERLMECIGKVTLDEMNAINGALAISLGICGETEGVKEAVNDLITIQGTGIVAKEYKGQRVVTFKDIDAVHNRPLGTASRNFNQNRTRFEEGKDFYNAVLTDNEIRRAFGAGATQSNMKLITETGYLMLVKSFNDNLAWTVQRELVDTYFKVITEPVPEPTQPVLDIMITAPEINTEVFLEASRIMAACQDGNRSYVLNILRHIVLDIDAEEIPQPHKPEITAKPPVVPVRRFSSKFYRTGVPCDIVKLKRTMNTQQMSMSYLAESAGISITTVRNIVNGKNRPMEETRTKMSRALGKNDNFLIPVTEAR